MKYADLHIHSMYSDGTKTPEKIIEIALKNKVKCISITDHDSLGAQYVTKNKYDNLQILSGIEISTDYKGIDLHLLGYCVDIEDKYLNDIVEKLRDERYKRLEQIIFKLKKYNIYINESELAIDFNCDNCSVGRSHIAKIIIKKGYCDSYKNAFKNFLSRGKVGYVEGFKLNYKEALEIILKSGGVAVLAHPGQIYEQNKLEEIIKELKRFGLAGLEVYHPSHKSIQINKFYNISKKNKLLVTGGSDYHGENKFSYKKIGVCGVNEQLLKKLINHKK